jgi:hypothetical protein
VNCSDMATLGSCLRLLGIGKKWKSSLRIGLGRVESFGTWGDAIDEVEPWRAVGACGIVEVVVSSLAGWKFPRVLGSIVSVALSRVSSAIPSLIQF